MRRKTTAKPKRGTMTAATPHDTAATVTGSSRDAAAIAEVEMDENDMDENFGVGCSEENNLGDENIQVSDDEIEDKPKNKRNRALSSAVWNYFVKIGVEKDGKERAQCKACGAKYVCGGSKYGTSTLLRHLKLCPKLKKFQDGDIGKLMLDQAGKLRARKLDMNVVHDLISMIIIDHDLPFSYVEYRRVRQLLTYLNPEFKAYSRRVATLDVVGMYEGEKRKMKEVLSKVPSRICLTSDVWTSCTTEGYISLTAHFVDEKWKLNSKILNFSHFPPPHSGREISKTVFGFLEEWGIEKKIFSLTLDNASANDNMQDLLKEQLLMLNNGLLCDGQFFHIRCCAHILNLIVQEGLKVTGNACYKIRESIKYVKGSEGRMNTFKACVQNIGGIDTKVCLKLDVPTRWNSTFMMLESAIAYRRAFSNLAFEDNNYKHCPSSVEWTRAEKMCDFLRPFNSITNLISGSSYPTSNMYFMQVWRIECLLIENENNEDVVIKDMAKNMKEKFDKYWSDYSIVLALGTVLDPHLKFSFIEFCYSKVGLDPLACKEKVEVVKEKLYDLFNEYVKLSSRDTTTDFPTQSSQASFGAVGSASGDPSQWIVMNEYLQYENQFSSQVGKSQLDIYLDDPKLSGAYHPNLDILEYWRDNKQRYPELALMACDILSIPITTVASESAFSIGSRVLTKYRSSILPENVQALICTRNWLLGFDPEGNDEVDNVGIEKKNEPKVTVEVD